MKIQSRNLLINTFRLTLAVSLCVTLAGCATINRYSSVKELDRCWGYAESLNLSTSSSSVRQLRDLENTYENMTRNEWWKQRNMVCNVLSSLVDAKKKLDQQLVTANKSQRKKATEKFQQGIEQALTPSDVKEIVRKAMMDARQPNDTSPHSPGTPSKKLPPNTLGKDSDNSTDRNDDSGKKDSTQKDEGKSKKGHDGKNINIEALKDQTPDDAEKALKKSIIDPNLQENRNKNWQDYQQAWTKTYQINRDLSSYNLTNAVQEIISKPISLHVETRAKVFIKDQTLPGELGIETAEGSFHRRDYKLGINDITSSDIWSNRQKQISMEVIGIPQGASIDVRSWWAIPIDTRVDMNAVAGQVTGSTTADLILPPGQYYLIADGLTDWGNNFQVMISITIPEPLQE